MMSPMSLQKRPTLDFDTCDSSSPISPLFHHPPNTQLTCDDSPSSSPSSVRLPQLIFPPSQSDLSMDTTTIPTLRMPLHFHHNTYGDLSAATHELILGFEERITHLESSRTSIAVELEATLDALMDERKGRTTERISLISAHSQLVAALGSQLNKRTNVVCERKLRDELLASLKSTRSQKDTIARSLREREERCSSLTANLEAELTARKRAEEEVARLSAANLTLLGHNRILFGRDSALQSDISSLLTKSNTDNRMYQVLEAELRDERSRHALEGDYRLVSSLSQPSQEVLPQPPFGITLECQEPLRHELDITQRRLDASTRQCATLSERILSLQQNISLCVDQSTNALEVERELRAELQGRLHELAQENKALKEGREKAEKELQRIQPFADAWKRKVGELREIEEMAVARALEGLNIAETPARHTRQSWKRIHTERDINLRMRRREQAADLHFHTLTSKRLRQRKKRRPNQPYDSPPAGGLQRPLFVFSPTEKNSPSLTSSPSPTLVASPTPVSSKLQKRMSVILAVTLSRNSVQGGLKTDSSIFVDTTSSCRESCNAETIPPGLSTVDSPSTNGASISVKRYMKRASAIFFDIANAYTSIEGLDE